MTSATDPIVYLLVRVPLLASDRDFIHGAITERRAAAAARGEHFDVNDFIREALIEAAQR